MSSFSLFAVGYALLLAGLIYAALILGAPNEWIIAGGLVLLGLGVMKAVVSTRTRDPSEQ